MDRSRASTAVAGVAVSLALSLLLWWYVDSVVFLLFVPFVPFLFGGRDRPAERECPVCGFRTDEESFEYCPRDGRRLR